MEKTIFVKSLGELLDRGYDGLEGLEGFCMIGGVSMGTSHEGCLTYGIPPTFGSIPYVPA